MTSQPLHGSSNNRLFKDYQREFLVIPREQLTLARDIHYSKRMILLDIVAVIGVVTKIIEKTQLDLPSSWKTLLSRACQRNNLSSHSQVRNLLEQLGMPK